MFPQICTEVSRLQERAYRSTGQPVSLKLTKVQHCWLSCGMVVASSYFGSVFSTLCATDATVGTKLKRIGDEREAVVVFC